MRIGPFTFSFSKKGIVADADILAVLGTGISTSTGVTVTTDQALRVPAVAAAVRTIAEAAASMRVQIVRVERDGSETVVNHPAERLLTGEANDWTSAFELIRQLVADALTRNAGGLAWVSWIEGNPVEIIRYEPGKIAVEYDPRGSGEPTYKIDGQPIARQSVIHLRGPFDKSPVTLAAEAIGVAVVMERHAARLFGSGAKPGGVISMEKGLGDEGAKKMLAGWRAAHEGSDNAGKTAILWDGAKWLPMTLNSVDAQFQQLRVFQLQEIARAFNIPAVMLGELSRATWSNSAEMQKLFLMLCLEPWLLAGEAALTRGLILREDRLRGERVRFVRDDFSKVDLQVLATAINSLVAARVLNPNEARGWLDMAPYDGGEEFANPNTGSSQPGGDAPADDETSDDEEDDDGAE